MAAMAREAEAREAEAREARAIWRLGLYGD